MVDILLLELATIVSLLYSLLLLFISFASDTEMFLIFVWTIAATTFFAWASRRSKYWQPSILLILLPLVFYNDKLSMFFILFSAVLTFLYTKTSLLKGSYTLYADNFKKTALIFVVAAFFRSSPVIVCTGSINHAAPFIIIYFISSVALIRSIRHLDSGMEPKRIKAANIRYVLGMFLASALTASAGFRNLILSVVKSLPYLLAYPFALFARLIGSVIELLNDYNQDRGAEVQLPDLGTEGQNGAEELEEVAEEVVAMDFSVIETIIGVLLVIAIIYTLYKLLSKAGHKSYNGLEYTEEREYIKTPKQKKKTPPRRRSDDLSDQIRYLYRRFLNKLAGKKVEVLKTDTSLEVNEKAETVFTAGTEEIRGIYIQSRYGGKEVEKATVAEMEKLYKDL